MISIGGADHAVFQWRFIPENASDSKSDVSANKLSNNNPQEKEEELDDLPEKFDGNCCYFFLLILNYFQQKN